MWNLIGQLQRTDATDKYPTRNVSASTNYHRIRLGFPEASSDCCCLRFPLSGRVLLHVSQLMVKYLGFNLQMLPFSWTYSSSLAYIVDANVGRSSTAVAANSAFRGIFAFVATEIAVPLQVRMLSLLL